MSVFYAFLTIYTDDLNSNSSPVVCQFSTTCHVMVFIVLARFIINLHHLSFEEEGLLFNDLIHIFM